MVDPIQIEADKLIKKYKGSLNEALLNTSLEGHLSIGEYVKFKM